MCEVLHNVIPAGIKWASYLFLGTLFLVVLRVVVNSSEPWGDMFTDRPGQPHHLARYVLLVGATIMAVKFLVVWISALHTAQLYVKKELLVDPHYKASEYLSQYLTEEINEVLRIFKGANVKLGVGEAAGAYSAAYLLAKVTNGQILTLFGRRRS